jgi:hypothetical protein
MVTPSAAVLTAHTFNGTPTVGTVFYLSYPSLHFCSGSVVRSPGRNVIMMAAHCMFAGSGKHYFFAPGYHNGKAPYGAWATTAAYGSPQWIKRDGDQRRDFVFLTVAPKLIHGKLENIQDVVGANRLGLRPSVKKRVRIVGYPLGVGGRPLTCVTPIYFHQGYPATNCHGFADGTSGGPWLAGTGKVRTVVGLISGLHQGGCSTSTTYSTPLGSPAMAVLTRAERGEHPDTFPTRPGDGCKNGF